jgi:hypothetical protein
MREDKLYAVALRCAELNDSGCECDCVNCQYNIFNYVDDVREASLLKANAYTDYHKQSIIIKESKDIITANTYAPLVALIMIIGLFAYCCSSVKSCFTPSHSTVSITQQQNSSDLESVVKQFY